MSTTYEQLQERIRQTPLLERLESARSMIGKMCSERRPPKITIPVQHYDEDIFISTTLGDAKRVIAGGWRKIETEADLPPVGESVLFVWHDRGKPIIGFGHYNADETWTDDATVDPHAEPETCRNVTHWQFVPQLPEMETAA